MGEQIRSDATSAASAPIATAHGTAVLNRPGTVHGRRAWPPSSWLSMNPLPPPSGVGKTCESRMTEIITTCP